MAQHVAERARIVIVAMPEILVATPLHHSVVSQPYTFPDGLSIRKLPPILWDKATVKRWVSEDDQKYMNEDRYWLCADKEVEYILGGMPQDLYEKAMHAALALQIIAPTGAKHVFMEFAITPEGLDNLGASHAKQLCSSRLSRLYHAESPENVASARSVHLPVEAHGGASLTMLARLISHQPCFGSGSLRQTRLPVQCHRDRSWHNVRREIQ